MDQTGRNYWWVAPVYPVARIAYRRMKRFLPAAVYTANESELCLTLGNGAAIVFKSGDKADSLYGEDVYAAVIDEASRVREDSFHAVRTTLTATRGPIRIIGNVKGRQNWAYRLARMAEQGTPDMAYFRLTAYDAVKAGVLDAEEIEDARRALPESVFRELYLAEPSDDGGNPFGVAAIRSCIAPLSTADPVAWGIDLAKSQDYTVAIALDQEKRVCRFERWQGPWDATIQRLKAIVGAQHSGAGRLDRRRRSRPRGAAEGRRRPVRGLQVHGAEQAAADGRPGRRHPAAADPVPGRADRQRAGVLRLRVHADRRPVRRRRGALRRLRLRPGVGRHGARADVGAACGADRADAGQLLGSVLKSLSRTKIGCSLAAVTGRPTAYRSDTADKSHLQ